MQKQPDIEEESTSATHANGEPGASMPQEAEEALTPLPFPVVGIGASAGGLKAFEQFIKALPDNSGMAFVLIQHLAPDHESELAELLQNHTHMAVNQIVDGTPLEPNCIYVIPPGKSLVIREGTLYLHEPEQAHGHRAPIDLFFRSLAEDQGENAVCVILSGTGSDGTLGLKAVKERAGITMAQLPEDAEYDGMPTSAIRTSLVDVTGTAHELAQKLVEYRDSAAKIQLPIEEEALPEDGSEALSRIFAQLHSRTGHDFTHYKRSTILRRIGRRLQVHGIGDMQNYLAYLRQNGEETQALFKDFLISVTNFFRDPEAFARLEKDIVPALFENKGRGDQVRVWVPGCATGEEAYSLAILLVEYAEGLTDPPEIQIFATDIDEEAIAFARDGFYNEVIETDVSPERLRRFFVEERGGYRVRKSVRERVLFAVHNLINDPPFSRLELISCRNLLIYLNRDVQTGIFEIFHYALRVGGYLFLGSSESAEGATTYFVTRDKKQRIYQRQDLISTPMHFPNMPLMKAYAEEDRPTRRRPTGQPSRSLEESYQAWRLRRYTPPAIIVNEQYDLIHVFGNAGRYLQVKEGPATHNILEQILPALRLDLRAALYQAFQKGERTVSRRLSLENKDDAHVIRLHVGQVEIEGFPPEYVEIVFEEVEARPQLLGASLETRAEAGEQQLVSQLEDELQRTRERLQTTIEEHETSNEELKASNEELQSMNEELQSTGEELETGKEELQSMNEELVTVNQELKNKIEELSHANSDLQNLMKATDIGSIFLDRNLSIKRFTPRIQDLFNILPSDVGRPFLHVSHKINYDGLPEDAARALRELTTIEHELESKDHNWYIVRILPYRTLEDQIDGVVLTFFDITTLKKYQAELAKREKQQAAIVALGHLALQNVDLETLVDEATKQLCQTLDLEFCDLLELNVDEDKLFFRSGVGWQDGSMGQMSVSAASGSQARYVLDSHAPVTMSNLPAEKRFEVAPHLRQHNIMNGLAVAVPSIERTWGILGAYGTKQRTYTEDDAHFLQSVANVLAEAITRKAAETTIRLSEERFRTALKNAPITVFNQDTDLVYTWIYNPVPEGPDLPNILGKYDEEVMERPEDAALLRRLKQQVLDQKQGRREEVAIAFDGQERYYDLTIEPLLDEDGEMVGITCASTDITQIKQAEQTLRTSEERLQIAVRNSGLSVSHVDENLRYTWIVNPQHPFAREEIVGKTDAELLGAERASGLTALKRQTLESGQGIHQEYTMYTVTGPRTWDVTLEPIPRANGTIGGVTTASLDITTRKQAEEALRVSENRLRLALEAGNMGIWYWNLNDDLLTWSDLQYALLGLAPDEPMTMERFYTLVHPDDRPQVQALFRQIQDAIPESGEASFEHEYRVVYPDGQVRWLSTRGALSCRNDQSTELLGVTFDITTHKEQAEEIRSFNTILEQRVQRRTAELEHSNQKLDQFAYVASHDLKAPLRAIQQLSNWLVEDLGDGLPAAAQKHVNRILNRVSRMERMLDDLLLYSRINRQGAVAAEIVDMQALINSVLETVVPPAGVTVTIADEPPTVFTVRTPLEMVLRNLIGNAIKHHNKAEVQITIAVQRLETQIEVMVTDDGPGIDQDYHERIFGLFQTLQPRDQIEGSGMGLAIVRRIVQEYDGAITVESAEGKGATFRFTWPIYDEATL